MNRKRSVEVNEAQDDDMAKRVKTFSNHSKIPLADITNITANNLDRHNGMTKVHEEFPSENDDENNRYFTKERKTKPSRSLLTDSFIIAPSGSSDNLKKDFENATGEDEMEGSGAANKDDDAAESLYSPPCSFDDFHPLSPLTPPSMDDHGGRFNEDDLVDEETICEIKGSQEEVETPSWFDALPLEILNEILSFLPSIYCLLRLRLVSRKMDQLCVAKIIALRSLETKTNSFMTIMRQNEMRYLRKYVDYFRIFQNRERVSSLPHGLHQNVVTEKMRSILIDWLIDCNVEIQQQLHWHPGTVFLAISIVDRYLSASHVATNELQLLGIVSLSLAAKYSEIEVTTIADLCYLTDGTYTQQQFLEFEANVANTLQFEFTTFTSQDFVDSILPIVLPRINNSNSRIVVNRMCHYLIELALLDYQMMRYRPSMIAGAAVFLSVQAVSEPWRSKYAFHLMLHEVTAFKECIEDLFELHKNYLDPQPNIVVGRDRMVALFNKYSPESEGIRLFEWPLVPVSLEAIQFPPN